MKTPSSPSPVTVEKVPIAQTVAQGGLLGGEQLTNQSKLVKKDAVSATTVQEKETLGKPGDVAANTVPGQMELNTRRYNREDMLQAWVAGRSREQRFGDSMDDAPDFASWIRDYAPSSPKAAESADAGSVSSSTPDPNTNLVTNGSKLVVPAPVASVEHAEEAKNFLTPKKCAEQFRMYAETNPSRDSKHSLKFCADFLDEFCIQVSGLKEAASDNVTAVLKMAREALEEVERHRVDGVDHVCWIGESTFMKVEAALQLLSEHGGQPSSATGASSQNSGGPIPLNDKQQMLIKEWSADSPHGDLWGNDEARAINLRTFARSILGAASVEHVEQEEKESGNGCPCKVCRQYFKGEKTLGKPGASIPTTVPGQMALMRTEMQAMNDRWARLHEQLRILPDEDWDEAPFSYIERLRSSPDIHALVNRFLAWPLPESVCSDQCATERGYPHRSGTNLLTADEARQMVEYILTPSTPKAMESDSASGVSSPNLSASVEHVEQEKIARDAVNEWFLLSRNWTGYDMPERQQVQLLHIIRTSIERAVKQQR